MTVVKISAKEMNQRFVGARGGYITGAYYTLYEEGKGFVTLDNKMPYMLKGRLGKETLEAIIADGGFSSEVNYITAY